jgi:putative ABC transport system permease protein
MRWWRRLWLRKKMEEELEKELRFHLEQHTADLIAQGLDPEEARRQARLVLSGPEQVKEHCRDVRGSRWLENLLQDMRYGARMLLKQPGFTLIAVITLALGIEANTAIFSVVNAALLRPLPYRDPDRIVTVGHYRPMTGADAVYGWDFLEWRDQSKVFEQIAAYCSGTTDLTGSGEPARLGVGFVSAELFVTLGVAPAHGRAFTSDEDKPGGAPVVILSHDLWQRRFGADPQVIGRALTLDGQSRTIIGIMPPGFQFYEGLDLLIPLAINVSQELRREPSTSSGVNVIARLKPGVTLEAARADLTVSLERQQLAWAAGPGYALDPKLYSDVKVRVINLSERLVGDVRLALLTQFGAVAFVLLIACTNVANLLLARASARQKEMAIRSAMGAGRFRLVRQLLTESLLLSLAGASAGLLLATWGVKLLVNMNPVEMAHNEESGYFFLMDGRVLAFTCAVTVLTGLLAGLFPSLQASKTDVNETLKSQSAARSVVGMRRRTLSALMIAELALTLVLLVGAGLMIKSFLLLLSVPKGFNPDGVMTLVLSPSPTKYPWGSPQRGAYYQELLTRAQALPGIHSASLTSFLPLAGMTYGAALQEIEGHPSFEPGEQPMINFNLISHGYFQTMGLQMRAGRPFTAQDGSGAPQVAIINETLARRFVHNENPIGRRLRPIHSNTKTIVGVVGDTRHYGLDRKVEPEIYIPYLQEPNYAMRLVVRAASDQTSSSRGASLSSLAAAIRYQVHAQDPNEPIDQIVTMDERLSDSVAQRRYQMFLFGVFAAVALVIATVGIYGVISYTVSQRTYEIGIRMALGAQAGDVLRMMVSQGMRLTLIGVTLGVTTALGLTRVIESLLFNVSATDPATFVSITLLLVIVALIAIYIPARRATKVDPNDFSPVRMIGVMSFLFLLSRLHSFPQRAHRINLCRPPGRDVTSQQRHQRERQ